MTDNLRDLRDKVRGKFQSLLDAREPTQLRYPGILGRSNTTGSATVTDQPRYCYVRIGSDDQVPSKVWNTRTPHINGLAVIVGYDPAQPGLFQVLSERGAIYMPDDDNPTLAVKHAPQHEWGNEFGFDIPYLDMRQVRGCRPSAASPASLYIEIDRGIYEIGTTLYEWDGSDIEGATDLTASVPVSGMRWVLITMDATGVPVLTNGTSAGLITIADIPASPNPSDFRIAAVWLKSGDTTITDWPDEQRIVDLRYVGSRAAASSGYVEWENCAVVAEAGGNYDAIQAAMNAATAGQGVLVLTGAYAENLDTPATNELHVMGLLDEHFTSGNGAVVTGADDVGPLLTVDTAFSLNKILFERALAGGAGAYTGIDASDATDTKHFSWVGVSLDGAATGRDVYGFKVAGPVGETTTLSMIGTVVTNESSGSALSLSGPGDFICELSQVEADDTALEISGTGTILFNQCKFVGKVSITGAATVTFKDCNITDDVTIAASGATVSMRSTFVGGDITIGAGDSITLLEVNLAEGKTVTGDGTILVPYLLRPTSDGTSHFFGALADDRGSYAALNPQGTLAGVNRSVFECFFTDFIADPTNFESTEIASFDDGVDIFSVLRSVKGGTGTQRLLRLGVGFDKTKYIEINAAGDIIMPTDATVDGHDINEMTAASNEPSGFPNHTDSVLSWVAGTRTLTITPAVTSFDVWQAGIKYVISSGEDIIIADTNGVHIVYYDVGVLAQVLNPSHDQIDEVIVDKAIVAIIYWNTNTNEAPIVADERHKTSMSGETHHYLHDNFGARYNSGLTLTGYVEDTDSDAALTFEVSDGRIYDEDIEVDIEDGSAGNQYEQQLNGGDAEIPVLYRDDIDGSWKEAAASTLPYLTTGSGRLAYNLDDGDGTFSQAEVTNNRFMSYTLVATNDWQYPIKMIQGQNDYTSVASAIEDATNEILALGDLPTPEMVTLYRLVMQTGSYGGTKQAKIVSVTDFRGSQISGVAAAATDHGGLGGLSDDDHAQYLDIAGVRAMGNTAFHIWDTGGDHYLTIQVNEDLTANKTLSILVNDGDQILSMTGNLTVESASTVNQDLTTDASPTFTGVRLGNTGLQVADTNASHYLIIAPGSDLTVNRTLTVTTGDADRTITLSGNPTLADWFDQSVKVAADPTFASVTIPNAGWIGRGVADERIEFYTAGDIAIMGADVGLGTITPSEVFHLYKNSNAQTYIRLENADAIGASSLAGFRVVASAAQLLIMSHGSARTITRYGVTLGDYCELLTSSGNGLLIGTGTLAKPIIFGTNGVERMRVLSGGALEIAEITAPGAGAANTCRLYCVDNGGKTELYAIFASGAAQLLASQP